MSSKNQFKRYLCLEECKHETFSFHCQKRLKELPRKCRRSGSDGWSLGGGCVRFRVCWNPHELFIGILPKTAVRWRAKFSVRNLWTRKHSIGTRKVISSAAVRDSRVRGEGWESPLKTCIWVASCPGHGQRRMERRRQGEGYVGSRRGRPMVSAERVQEQLAADHLFLCRQMDQSRTRSSSRSRFLLHRQGK